MSDTNTKQPLKVVAATGTFVGSIGNIIFGYWASTTLDTDAEAHEMAKMYWTYTSWILMLSGIALMYFSRIRRTFTDDIAQFWWVLMAIQLSINLLTTPAGPIIAARYGKEDIYWENYLIIQVVLWIVISRFVIIARNFINNHSTQDVATEVPTEVTYATPFTQNVVYV